jgi:hypothetical protein
MLNIIWVTGIAAVLIAIVAPMWMRSGTGRGL